MKDYFSYAKINLYLDIVSKYKNGYHGLKSIFAQISLADDIQYSINSEKRFTFTDRSGLLPEKNLLTKAFEIFKEHAGLPPAGVDFIIDKNIPLGGGLGGGSSNAAAVLTILNSLMPSSLSVRQLTGMAHLIGADVPFFIKGGIQKACGIGQILKPLKIDKIDFNLLLLFPETGVSTPDAFGIIDRDGSLRHSYDSKKKYRALIEGLQTGNYKMIIDNVYNKFEEAVFEMYPVIRKNYNELLDNNADKVLMSGSGSTLIAFFDCKKKLDKCRDALLNINHRVKEVFINF